MNLQLCKNVATSVTGQQIANPLVSFAGKVFLQTTLKTMHFINQRKEARRMNQSFLTFPRCINLSSPPIRPMVESTLLTLHDQLNIFYRPIRRDVPQCSQE